MLQSSLAATVARHEATLAQLEADHSDTCQQLQQQLGQQLTDAQDKHSAETHVSRSPHASAHTSQRSQLKQLHASVSALCLKHFCQTPYRI